jgi:hypothetical protein
MNNQELTNAVDQLIKLGGHTEIVKHSPGQIHLRVKLTGVSLALNLAASLKDVRLSLKGILGATGDVSKRSIMINYDEKVLPKELWELLIKSHANPKIQQLVKREILSRVSA